MKRRVKITKLPSFGHGSEVRLGGGDTKGGYPVDSAKNSLPDLNVSSFISPVPRDQANIEAEKGETMITPMGDDARTKTLPKTFTIGGKKHSGGGTPLNVPDGTFVFSDHLKETNQDIHAFFNKKPKKSGYTYAELSKPYMVNKDLKHLIDSSSDKISQETAKMNIQNKLEKLSLLSLLQESKKGFGDGEEFEVPEVGMVHLEKTGLDIAQAIQPYLDAITPQAQAQPQMQRRGGPVRMKNGGGVKGLKPGHRIDRTTGEIIDENGRVVGIVTAGGDAVTTKKTKKASIPDGATVIRRKDYATDAEYIAARDTAFTGSEGASIYTQDINGTYRKVGTKTMTFDPYQGDLLETTFNNNQNVADQYYYLQQKFNTPEAKKALQDRAIAAYENPANVRGISQSQVKAAVKRLKDNPDLAYNQFMDMQQRNMSLAANGYEVSTFQNSPGSNGTSNQDFEDAYKKIGLKAPNKEDAAMQQAIYIGYRDLLKERDAGTLTDENLLATLENFNITQVGQGDDAIAGDREGSISMIDGIYTNTTAGEIAGITADPQIFEEDLADEKDSDIDIKTIKGVTDQTPHGWRAPDVKRLMSATKNLSSDVKEQPWAKIPDYHIPNVYLDSPDQRAFNERGRIKGLEDTLSTYATPGTLAASASALSGAGNVGQYISQVGRENKDRVNQHSAQVAGILNAAAGERAQIATSLHDKRALVNEKHRAFKREATKQWDDAYDWGFNKAAELAMVNARTPNYNVDPWSGKIQHVPGGPLTPNTAGTKTMMDRVAEYKETYPHISDDVIYKAVKEEMGITEQTPSYLNYGAAATQPG